MVNPRQSQVNIGTSNPIFQLKRRNNTTADMKLQANPASVILNIDTTITGMAMTSYMTTAIDKVWMRNKNEINKQQRSFLSKSELCSEGKFIGSTPD